MKSAKVIVSILLVTLLSFNLSAQSNATDWSRLSSIDSGAKLSVKLKTGKEFKGTFSSVSESALTLDTKQKPLVLKREEIATVQQTIKKGSGTKAALLGMGIGGGAGALVGAAGSRDDFDKIEQAATAGLAVIGAVVGGVTGYFIGRGSSKKILVYQGN